MASHQSVVDDLLERLAGAGDVTARKMFGEFCVYLEGKPVALVCDDQLYVKPTAGGRALMPDVAEAPPYPGAKPHLLIPEGRWADRPAMAELLRTTFEGLPTPKPKRPKSA